MARQDARTRYRLTLAVGLLASVVLHVFVFRFFPTIEAHGVIDRARALRVIQIPPAPTPAPPQTRVPEEPAPIATPATPLAVKLKAPPDAPHFIPYEIAPRLENSAEVQRLLQNLYPVDYRDKDIGGVVVLWLFVDTDGNVQRVVVRTPSGHDEFDAAAREVAHRMAFRPAFIHGHAVGVWVSQGIRFTVQKAVVPAAAGAGGADSLMASTGRGGHHRRPH